MQDWQYSVKRDLQEYNAKAAAIASIKEELDTIEAALTSIGSGLGSDSVKAGGSSADDRVVAMLFRRGELTADLMMTQARHKRITDALEGLKTEERTLLDRMYINHIPLRDVCELMHLESSQVYDRAKKALYRLAVYMYGDMA